LDRKKTQPRHKKMTPMRWCMYLIYVIVYFIFFNQTSNNFRLVCVSHKEYIAKNQTETIDDLKNGDFGIQSNSEGAKTIKAFGFDIKIRNSTNQSLFETVIFDLNNNPKFAFDLFNSIVLLNLIVMVIYDIVEKHEAWHHEIMNKLKSVLNIFEIIIFMILIFYTFYLPLLEVKRPFVLEPLEGSELQICKLHAFKTINVNDLVLLIQIFTNFCFIISINNYCAKRKK